MFNQVAPYRYLLPNVYLSVADIANPDLVACGSRTWISLNIGRFYEEQYHHFFSNQYHQRCNCPAREVICNNCGVKGHFAKVCLSKKRQNSAGTTPYSPTICAMGILAIFPHGLSHAAVTVT